MRHLEGSVGWAAGLSASSVGQLACAHCSYLELTCSHLPMDSPQRCSVSVLELVLGYFAFVMDLNPTNTI